MPIKIPIASRNDLEYHYVTLKKSMPETAKVFNVTYPTIRKWLKFYDIPQRTPTESQKIRFQKHNPQKRDISSSLLEDLLITQNLSIDDTADILGVSRELIDKRKQEFGIYTGLRYPAYGSKQQREIFDFCDSFTPCEENNRTILSNDKELDIWIPEKNLAIEYCGLYWHSECHVKDYKIKFFNRMAHYNKFHECREMGIQLITIFEDEWNSRQDIVKDILRHKMGYASNRIFARKCYVREIDRTVARKFMDENHIQGSPQWIRQSFGLFHEDQLVGCVTYSRHHRNNKDWVLNRLCFLKNHSIVGGASKLVKSTIRDGTVSWSDNRWSDGGIYRILGFSIEEHQKPDYSYTNRFVRKGKQSFKNKSTDGWGRIWDCGKIKWRKHVT